MEGRSGVIAFDVDVSVVVANGDDEGEELD